MKDETNSAPPLASTVDLRGATMAKNVAMNFIGLAIPYLVAFVTIPIVIKYLGLERFGILSLIWVIFGYFTLFDLGLGRTTTKYVAEALGRGEMSKLPQYLWTTVILQACFALLGVILFISIIPLLVGRILNIPAAYIAEAKTTFALVALSLPINFVMHSFRGTLEAGQKFGLVNAVKIPASVFFYILPLVGVLLGFKLPGIVILLILSRLLSLLAWFLLCLKVYPVLKKKPVLHRTLLKPLFRFSAWIAISGVIYSITTSLDKLLIGALLTVKAVAFYSAPNELLMRFGIIPGSFSLVLFPAFSSLMAGGQQDKIENLYSRSVKFLLIFAGPLLVLIICYARPFLHFWLGHEFAQNSTLLVQLLAAGFLVNSLWTVPFSYLQGIGRADITTKLQFLEAVFYIMVSVVFIKLWGITGAAAAAALRTIVFTLILIWISIKTGRLHARRIWNGKFYLAISLLLLYLIFLSLFRKIGFDVLGFLFFSGALIFSIVRFVLEPDEKKFLKGKLLSVFAAKSGR